MRFVYEVCFCARDDIIHRMKVRIHNVPDDIGSFGYGVKGNVMKRKAYAEIECLVSGDKGMQIIWLHRPFDTGGDRSPTLDLSHVPEMRSGAIQAVKDTFNAHNVKYKCEDTGVFSEVSVCVVGTDLPFNCEYQHG